MHFLKNIFCYVIDFFGTNILTRTATLIIWQGSFTMKKSSQKQIINFQKEHDIAEISRLLAFCDEIYVSAFRLLLERRYHRKEAAADFPARDVPHQKVFYNARNI